MIKQKQTIKSLMSQKASLEVEISEAENKRCLIDNDLNFKRKKLNEIINKLNGISDEPQITEHALLRYIQRIKGVDIEEIKKEIMTDKNKAMIETLGSGTFKLNGIKMIVKDKTIITLMEN